MQLITELPRHLTLDLPPGQSAFLWGARKTGKSFYLSRHFKNSVYYNLLDTDLYINLLKQPYLLRQEVLALSQEQLAYPIIIDEIQKIPQLLDEVHNLIENSAAYFILCGSSARKLRQVGVNLLGGRAWSYHFFPLVYPEIPHFNLLTALNQGLVPSHYLAQNFSKTIKAYVNDYLTEEIKAESLTRNLRAFAEFLEVAAFSNGEILNYSNVARDCGVDAKTIKEYYQILVDTLLGYYIYPYKSRKKKDDIVATPKFYFSDVGVANGLNKTSIAQIKGDIAGKLLEHYILMELKAYSGLNDLGWDISFWRTKAGSEVDFVIEKDLLAVEVKVSANIRNKDIKDLVEFQKSHQAKHAIVVAMIDKPRKITMDGVDITVLPWEDFLQQLWQGSFNA